MVKEIYLYVGIPASGKSTAATAMREVLSKDGQVVYISRDAICKSFVGETPKDYFEFETLVFEKFIFLINRAMDYADYIIIDATHINKASRAKLMKELRPAPTAELHIMVFETSLEECTRRNELREGFAKVPKSVIRRMYNQYEEPTVEEFKRYNFKDVIIWKAG